MTRHGNKKLPSNGRQPALPPAPPATERGITQALTAVYCQLNEQNRLTPAHRPEAQRLFKQARKWKTKREAQRAALWHQVTKAGAEAGYDEPSLRALALHPGAEDERSPGVNGPRGVHEMTPRGLKEHSDRMQVIAYLTAGRARSEIVQLMTGIRSRAWVYAVVARYARNGDVADRRTVRRIRERRIPAVVHQFVEAYCFRKKALPTITDITRRVRQACKTLELPVPSESWVRQQLRDEPQLELFRSNGAKAYRQQHRPVTVLDLGALPGDRFQVDSTRLDVWLQEPGPDGAPRPVRPSITTVVDVASRAIVGYYVTPGDVSEASVLKAVLHAMVDNEELPGLCGKPKAIQFDRGNEASDRLRAHLGALGIEIVRTPPRTPDLQGKVERSIGTMNTWLGEVPGYIPVVGGTVEHAQRVTNVLWSLDGFRMWLADRVTQHNDVDIHHVLGMTRRMAWELHPAPRQLTEEDLLSFLVERRTVTVAHGLMTVQFGYRRYYYSAEFMEEYPNRQLELRCSRFGETAHIFDPATGRYLGPAIALDASTSEQDIERIRSQRSRLLARRRELLMPKIHPAELNAIALADGSSPLPRIALHDTIEPIVTVEAIDVPPRIEGGSQPLELPEDEQVARIKALRQGRTS